MDFLFLEGDGDFICTQQTNDRGWWSSNHWFRYLSIKNPFIFEMLVKAMAMLVTVICCPLYRKQKTILLTYN